MKSYEMIRNSSDSYCYHYYYIAIIIVIIVIIKLCIIQNFRVHGNFRHLNLLPTVHMNS